MSDHSITLNMNGANSLLHETIFAYHELEKRLSQHEIEIHKLQMAIARMEKNNADGQATQSSLKAIATTNYLRSPPELLFNAKDVMNDECETKDIESFLAEEKERVQHSLSTILLEEKDLHNNELQKRAASSNAISHILRQASKTPIKISSGRLSYLRNESSSNNACLSSSPYTIKALLHRCRRDRFRRLDISFASCSNQEDESIMGTTTVAANHVKLTNRQPQVNSLTTLSPTSGVEVTDSSSTFEASTQSSISSNLTFIMSSASHKPTTWETGSKVYDTDTPESPAGHSLSLPAHKCSPHCSQEFEAAQNEFILPSRECTTSSVDISYSALPLPEEEFSSEREKQTSSECLWRMQEATAMGVPRLQQKMLSEMGDVDNLTLAFPLPSPTPSSHASTTLPTVPTIIPTSTFAPAAAPDIPAARISTVTAAAAAAAAAATATSGIHTASTSRPDNGSRSSPLLDTDEVCGGHLPWGIDTKYEGSSGGIDLFSSQSAESTGFFSCSSAASLASVSSGGSITPPRPPVATTGVAAAVAPTSVPPAGFMTPPRPLASVASAAPRVHCAQLRKGQQVWYSPTRDQLDGASTTEEELVIVTSVHLDDFPNVYYTIRLLSDNREKQTVPSRLREQELQPVKRELFGDDDKSGTSTR